MANPKHGRNISIGDASSLFGGGANQDDFFGPPPSASKAPTFGAVPEEDEGHDVFAWPPAGQQYAHDVHPQYAAMQPPAMPWVNQPYGGAHSTPNSSTYAQTYAPSIPYDPYSPAHSAYEPQRTASVPLPGTAASPLLGPSTAHVPPPPPSRSTAYDAYDPPPTRKKSLTGLSRHSTPGLPAMAMSSADAVARQNSDTPPPPPKRQPGSRPSSALAGRRPSSAMSNSAYLTNQLHATQYPQYSAPIQTYEPNSGGWGAQQQQSLPPPSQNYDPYSPLDQQHGSYGMTQAGNTSTNNYAANQSTSYHDLSTEASQGTAQVDAYAYDSTQGGGWGGYELTGYAATASDGYAQPAGAHPKLASHPTVAATSSTAAPADGTDFFSLPTENTRRLSSPPTPKLQSDVDEPSTVGLPLHQSPPRMVKTPPRSRTSSPPQSLLKVSDGGTTSLAPSQVSPKGADSKPYRPSPLKQSVALSEDVSSSSESFDISTPIASPPFTSKHPLASSSMLSGSTLQKVLQTNPTQGDDDDEDDAWGLNEEDDVIEGGKGTHKATPDLGTKSDPLPVVDDLDDAWGLEEDDLGIAGDETITEGSTSAIPARLSLLNNADKFMQGTTTADSHSVPPDPEDSVTTTHDLQGTHMKIPDLQFQAATPATTYEENTDIDSQDEAFNTSQTVPTSVDILQDLDAAPKQSSSDPYAPAAGIGSSYGYGLDPEPSSQDYSNETQASRQRAESLPYEAASLHHETGDARGLTAYDSQHLRSSTDPYSPWPGQAQSYDSHEYAASPYGEAVYTNTAPQAYDSYASDPNAPSQYTSNHQNHDGLQSSYGPYAPQTSTAASQSYDPYAPQPSQDQYQTSQGYGYQPSAFEVGTTDPYAYATVGQSSTDSYAAPSPYAPIQRGYANAQTQPPTDWLNSDAAQDNAQNRAADTTYAPASATTRAGQHDPLDRTRANVALATFGFGGKFVTLFPPSYGGQFGSNGDVYGSSASASTTSVTIRKMTSIVESLTTTMEEYPGPLFMDGGSRTSLGKKRRDVVAWLDKSIEESERENSYVEGLSKMMVPSTNSKEEGANFGTDKCVLLKLLKVLVEHEGKLSGSPRVEEAVKNVLVPDLKSPTSLLVATNSTPLFSPLSSNDTLLATYTVTSSSIDSLQLMLMGGDRQAALRFAISKQLWPHAFVIANSLGGDHWKQAVHEFCRYELSGKSNSGEICTGREPLRGLYSLFAGSGSSAMDIFLPPSPTSSGFNATVMSIQPTLVPGRSPMAPISRGPSPAPPSLDYRGVGKISVDVLSQWKSSAALVLANRTSGDSQYLASLGDALASNGRIEAAHSLYLLSTIGNVGSVEESSSRVTLLGIDARTHRGAAPLEAIRFTEVYEFALSLATVSKGQDAFQGFPHLQTYKLALANELASNGSTSTAQRYCDAIAAILKAATKSSNQYHPTLVSRLKELGDRIVAAPVVDRGQSSWISRKMQRPNLDSVWTNLEGKISKFVAGEGEEGLDPRTAKPKLQGGQVLGPFSHYSSISPASTSGTLSRAQSQSDLMHTFQVQGFPSASLVPSSASPTGVWNSSRSQRSSSFGTQSQGYEPNVSIPWNGPSEATTPMNEVVLNPLQEAAPSQGGWWEASGNSGSSQEPPAPPTFTSVEGSGTDPMDDASGFIDPMAAFTGSQMTGYHSRYSSHGTSTIPEYGEEGDAEDLGFGNRKSVSPNPTTPTQVGDEKKASVPKVEQLAKEEDEQRPQLKGSASGSWLGRWFKRDGAASPGPVRAKLGDEVSLVYDPESKRWVNKKDLGKGGAPVAATPPPPSRALTSSPTTAARGGGPPPPISVGNSIPPLPRSMLSSPVLSSGGGAPPPPTLRSTTSMSVLGSDTSSTPPPPPPGGGPRKASGKKAIRARYVEIQ